MSAHPNDLTAIVKLISDSVAVVTSEYAKAGHSPPTLDSTGQDPFHSPELVSERLKVAIKIIEAACAQLSATVASAGHVITNVSALCRNYNWLFTQTVTQKAYSVGLSNAFSVTVISRKSL